ncbi:MAG: VOC family protein [Gammaproteobacteria bacterium]|nr:VOC family protein [Gammaproteobacteria bacterium]
MGVDVQGLGQVSLTADDVSRATMFYRDVVGLAHLFEGGGMSFFDLGGARLAIGPKGGEAEHGSSILYYRVGDIDSAHAVFEAKEVTVLEAPQEVHRQGNTALWLAFYRDTEGNAFALMEERQLET